MVLAWVLCLREKLSQHVLQDPAVAIVGGLGWGVDTHGGGEFLYRGASRGPDGDLTWQGPGLPIGGEAGDRVHLLTGEPEAGGRFPGR